MKKTILITMLFILAAALTACNGAASASVSTDSGNGPLSTDYENALSIPMQLAVGTFKLDGTDNQVDADTASALLPLWKAVRSLSSSDSAAAEEIQAVYNQIQETMTPEQIQTISEMQLTFGDMGAVAQEMDLNFGAGGRFGDFTPEQQETAQAARESGQIPEGGFGGDGNFPIPEGGFPGGGPGGRNFPGGGFQGGQPGPELQATVEARRASGAGGTGANFGLPTALLDALIQYLEGVAS